MTVIQAADRLADAVVMPLPSFRLHPGEPLGPGLKRLGVEAIDEAVSGFHEGEEMFGEAVHIPEVHQANQGDASTRPLRSRRAGLPVRERMDGGDTARLSSASTSVMVRALRYSK